MGYVAGGVIIVLDLLDNDKERGVSGRYTLFLC
jgi:hypothetical protein